MRGKCCAQPGAGLNTHYLGCWLSVSAAGCMQGLLLCMSLCVLLQWAALPCRASNVGCREQEHVAVGVVALGPSPEGHPKPQHNTHCCVKCMHTHMHLRPCGLVVRTCTPALAA